jgi:putative DNA primase/helicase
LPHHVKHLRQSGLTNDTILAAGIYSETSPDKLAVLLNWRKPFKRMAPAIVFPFVGADGRNGYSRIRPDTPRTIKQKPIKYESPRGEPNRIYLPPGVAEKLDDASCELLVTEGEKKSLAATQFGFPCIGLVGVYGWKPKGEEKLLPELERVKWQGRHVRIVFDSDITEKSDVALAESKLAKHLQDRGANVRCVRLPDGPADESGEPTKSGLDDFLVAHGAGELRKLLDGAAEPEPLEGADVKQDASNIEPAREVQEFLQERTTDGLSRLRYWRGEFCYWRGGRYMETPTSEVQAELILSMNQNYVNLTTSITSNLMQQVKAQTCLPSRVEPPAWLDEPPYDWPAKEVLATRTELVHIPSLVAGDDGYTIRATPRYFAHTALDYEFKCDAPEPSQWLAFLAQLWPDDAESISTLQEWFGYLLTPDTSQQKIFMLIGPPRSGKGTIARVLTAMLGAANVAGPTLASFEQNFGLQSLLGKSLAIINDARLSGRADQTKVVERLLSISGEDSLDVDRKHREPVTGKIPARLMIVSNELPRLAESSGALAHRMIVLKLTANFLGREDRQLTDKLKTELPGILLWAIAGWQRLNERGYFRQPASGNELAAEMKDLSSPIAQFVRECCQTGPKYQAAVDDVYAAWGEWCKRNGRDHVSNKQTFGRDLRAALPGLRDSRPRDGEYRIRVYEGISLID